MSEDYNILKKQEDDSLNPFKLKIFIRGVQVKNSNIVNVIIRESIFGVLPVLDMTFNDYGLFTDVFPLGDEDEITVQISTDKDLEGIKTSFSINDYHIIPMNTDNHQAYTISFSAFLKNDYMLFPIQSQAFSNTTSSNVLNQIFEDSGFIVKNRTKTRDTMTWLQSSISNLAMVNHVIDYAYKEDGNIVFAFVDKNNNAYITDLITEINKPKSFNIKKSTDPITLYYTQLSSEEKKIKVLGYNFFRMGFHPGTNNKTGGYGIDGCFYDYDKPSTFITKMNTDIHPMTDYSLKNKKFIKNIVSDNEYLPMKYKNSNVHSNYHKAYLQNKFLRKTFFSDVLIVNSYFNDEVKLLDKVIVDINALAHSGADTLEINKVYSGEYLVVGIINQVNNGGNYKSILYLSRGGINQSALVDKTEMKLNG